MPLPTPNLDDLRFQRDLVDEARRRIIRYCPEWTEYNVSDPGITLIELFAWMTELIVYRLNRVPEKNYVKFLELLGFQLQPASSARTKLTFWLSAPLPLSSQDTTTATVPQNAEIATRTGELEQEIVFTTDATLTLARPLLTQVRQEADLTRNYLPSLGMDTFYPFSRPQPHQGDTFYLGFDERQSLAGYILRLAFECLETQAVGVRREDPPLVWECSLGNDEWAELPLSQRFGESDTTGGLNNPIGSLVLYLPVEMRPDMVHGRNAYWLRCRFEQRRKEQGLYTEFPRLRNITPYVLGGTTWATHAQIVRNEALGFSNGEPGQAFHLQHAPVLALRGEETVEVEELSGGEVVYVPWQRVSDFAISDRFDRHFTLDEATGEIAFGPAVRQPDGSVRQYGRIPEAARRVRVNQYRHGGGSAGSLPPDKLQVLRSAIPYVDRVTNLQRAEGGRDQESLDEAKLRARRELRAQQRAVTAEDFENLALAATRAVGRVHCRTRNPGEVELLLVPAAVESLRARDLSKLQVEQPLREAVNTYLDRYRLLATILRLREPAYMGVQVCVQVAVNPLSRPEEVRGRVDESLRNLLSPLALDQAEECRQAIEGETWEGWPFGRDLYLSEIYSWVQHVPGVKHVLDVRLSCRQVVPAREAAWGGAHAAGGPADTPLPPMVAVTDRVMRVPADTLLCSLEHEVEVVDL